MGTYIWRITVYIQLYIYCVTSIQSILCHYNCDLNIFNMLAFTYIALSVLYWKLTRSLSKSYPGVCLRTRFLLVAKFVFAVLKHSTVLLLTALSVSVFQSFTVIGKKECLYIFVMAESTLQLANMILN